MCMQSCTYLIDGKTERALLGQVLQPAVPNLPSGERPASNRRQRKIHSYLFSSLGHLLHANDAAIDYWKSRGNDAQPVVLRSCLSRSVFLHCYSLKTGLGSQLCLDHIWLSTKVVRRSISPWRAHSTGRIAACHCSRCQGSGLF